MNGYDGEEISYCDPNAFASGRGEVVVVSGDGINICGHVLLNVVGFGYRHLRGETARPRYLRTSLGFDRYLRENQKRVYGRYSFEFSSPACATRRYCHLIAEYWKYGLIRHNCASFVRSILSAGGISGNFPVQCPNLSIPYAIISPSHFWYNHP